MKNKTLVSILLVVAIIVVANLVSQRLYYRMDLTENGQYTLSKPTRDILRSLNEPVTVTAYFSGNMPPDIEKAKRDFQEMLVEFVNLSKGQLDYQFIDPTEDAQKQEALQAGIQPVMINVREKDQAKQQQAFLGAIVRAGGEQEILPFLPPGEPIEYDLARAIKKLSVKEKPSLGLVQGHGEPGMAELGQVMEELNVLYSVENVGLEAESSIPDRFRTVAIVAPKDTIPPGQLAKLDDYLSRGGKLFIAMNAVQGDFQSATGSVIHTGLEDWLATKGLKVENSFAIDAQCGTVQVQQQQGFFTIRTPVQFPFLPIITNFPEHPATKGLEQAVMTFASPMQFTGSDGVSFTPIALTSVKSGVVTPPTYFDINKQWTDADFPMSNLIVGGVLEGKLAGEANARIIVIGDGDFPVSGQQGRQNPDNISLMANSIDWLSDDTGLIELRTKAVATRPISQEYLSEDASGKRNFLKYFNFGLPIMLVLLYGFLRFQREKRIRLKRMQERYV
ncbi:MAG: GldG family protein [Phaeodactylibacter sp.]|nr:GldG family protein [Phaeodactylibacter sp.]MCB9276899.1 GldG family protein [Lewinellaceae bacterium]